MSVNTIKKGAAQVFFAVGGWFCLFFSLIPALFYRIAHIGVLALFLAALFLFALSRFWPLIGRIPRMVILIFFALGATAAMTLSALMTRQAWFSPPPAGRPVTVVVLGSKVNGGYPSLMLARRLIAAAKYLAAHPQAMCIVSGGQGPDEDFPEAQIMAAYLEELGIEPARIIQEDRSTNTQENLAFSLAILQPEGPNGAPLEIAVATDAFHQLRACVFASSMRLRSYSLPAETPWGLIPSYWVREWVGLPVAWLKIHGVG